MSSPSEILEFQRARLDEDEQTARTSAAANPGSVATHWSAEQVDHLSSTGLRGKAWAVVPERVKGVTIAISPTEIRPLFVTHIARHDPGRVLAEVEAKRGTIRLYEDTLATIETFKGHGVEARAYEVAAESYLNVIRLDAAVYASHPEYDESWRP